MQQDTGRDGTCPSTQGISAMFSVVTHGTICSRWTWLYTWVESSSLGGSESTTCSCTFSCASSEDSRFWGLALSWSSRSRKKSLHITTSMCRTIEYVVARQASRQEVAGEIFFSRLSALAAWLPPSKCCPTREAIMRIPSP